MRSLPAAFAMAEQALAAGDLGQAQLIFRQVLQAVPNQPHALTGLGVVAFRAGRQAEAESLHRQAIALLPGNATFHDNLFLVLYRQGRGQEAADCCRRSIELKPASATAHSNLGIALRQCGRIDEGIDSLRRAIELDPAHVDAHFNLANSLAACEQFDEAEAEFCRTLELAPADVQALNNLAALRQLMGKYDAAAATFDEALRCCPRSPELRHNRAILNLLRGHYRESWGDYQCRWEMPGAVPPTFAQPHWNGESLEGRTILLWGEQGLGDVIMMARYAPLVKERGATVLLECQPALRALLGEMSAVDRVVDTRVDRTPFDYYLPMLSMPQAFGTALESIPHQVPYLSVPRARVDEWRTRLSCQQRFKVGIAWQGNPDFPGDRYRSIPLLQFKPLVGCPGVQFFSLQKGSGCEQLAPLIGPWNLDDLGAELDVGAPSTVDAAAAIVNLDLVITSDTMLAHLAGALAVPVWVGLPFSPNWPWLLARDDSPWYPTMRLFRQPSFGDWPSVFARMAEALRSLSSARVVS